MALVAEHIKLLSYTVSSTCYVFELYAIMLYAIMLYAIICYLCKILKWVEGWVRESKSNVPTQQSDFSN